MAKRQQDAKTPAEIGKRVTFDRATWMALDLYARDSMKTIQEVADEAFADFLEKARPSHRSKGRAQTQRTFDWRE